MYSIPMDWQRGSEFISVINWKKFHEWKKQTKEKENDGSQQNANALRSNPVLGNG